MAFYSKEIPIGTINGTNVDFKLSHRIIQIDDAFVDGAILSTTPTWVGTDITLSSPPTTSLFIDYWGDAAIEVASASRATTGSTFAELKIRLSEVLKRSETRNLTEEQRGRALNDALKFDINNYRPWNFLVENRRIQSVDGIINIPSNFRKEYNLSYDSNRYIFIDQTRFLEDIPYTAAVTEYNNKQVIQLHPTEDNGVDQENKTASFDLGISNNPNITKLTQTIEGISNIKGVNLRLKDVGNPTGTVTLNLYATTGGLPTGNALASATLQTELTSSYDWYFFEIIADITAGDTYALVLETTDSTDTANYVAWEYSNVSVTTGTRGIYDGTTYSTETGDMAFIIYKDVYDLQYSKHLYTMENGGDMTGVPEGFDEAICMLAAARLVSRMTGGSDQTGLAYAQELRYGTGGNQANPTPDSAYGKLNTLWSEYRIYTQKPFRRMVNIYENVI